MSEVTRISTEQKKLEVFKELLNEHTCEYGRRSSISLLFSYGFTEEELLELHFKAADIQIVKEHPKDFDTYPES